MSPMPLALRAIVAVQDGLFTRVQARDAGLTDNGIQHREGLTIARVLPTVYTTTMGELTFRQRLRAAVLYGRIGGADDVAAVGGLAACALHGLKTAGQPATIELLLPMKRRLTDCEFVVVRRTTRVGQTWRVELPFSSAARAVVDASRRMRQLDDVRALVAECVQQRKATTEQIAEELRKGGSAGSALARRVLAEVADGVHSVAEAQLRHLLMATELAGGSFNVDLLDANGSVVARPDVLWADARLIVEVESREWHFAPETWAATMRRTNLLTRMGYTVQQFPPSRIATEPAAVLAEIREAHRAGLDRHGRDREAWIAL